MEAGAPTTWLITREAADAAEERATLEAKGVRVVTVACIEHEALPWPKWPRREGTPVYFLTSRHAAQAFLANARDERCFTAAMAPATSSVLEEAGVAPTISAKGGAVALAKALVSAWEELTRPAWIVRYPTSDAGLKAPEQAQAVEVLLAVDAVDRAAVYTTRAPAGLRYQLQAAARAPWAATFSSPSAVQAFFDALPQVPAPRYAVCHGRSTARAWDDARPPGWPAAQLTNSLVDAVLSLEATP